MNQKLNIMELNLMQPGYINALLFAIAALKEFELNQDDFVVTTKENYHELLEHESNAPFEDDDDPKAHYYRVIVIRSAVEVRIGHSKYYIRNLSVDSEVLEKGVIRWMVELCSVTTKQINYIPFDLLLHDDFKENRYYQFDSHNFILHMDLGESILKPEPNLPPVPSMPEYHTIVNPAIKNQPTTVENLYQLLDDILNMFPELKDSPIHVTVPETSRVDAWDINIRHNFTVESIRNTRTVCLLGSNTLE